MSVLIKGMDMPISCEKCPLCYDYLHCSIDDSLHLFLYNRHPNCPLVEIPTPHGRLIDASTETTVKSMSGTAMDVGMLLIALKQYVPTILEAEE